MSREKSLKGWLFAKQGEEAKPQTPLAGVTYRNEQLSKELVEKGWPFKEIVNSEDFNQFLYLLTSVVKHLESQGVLHWSEEVNYERGALVLSDDYYVYQAVKESGPDSVGYKNPQTSPEYWELFTQGGILDPNAGQKFGKLSWYQYDQPNQVNPLDNEKIEYVLRDNRSCYDWRRYFLENPEEYKAGLDCGWKDYIFGNSTQSWVYESFYDEESSQYQIRKIYHDKARMYQTSGTGELDEEGNFREVTRCILTPQGYRYYKGETIHLDVAGDPDYKDILVPEYTLMDSGKKWKKMREFRIMRGQAQGHLFVSAIVALDAEGYLWAWGKSFHFVNNGVQRDDIEMKKISEQRFIDFEVSLLIQESDLGILRKSPSCYALSADGKLYSWGRYTFDDPDNLLSQVSTEEDPNVFFRNIYPWYGGVLALDSKGRLWGCGKNKYGELCNGTQEDQKTFAILNHSEWMDIAQIGNPLVLLDRESHPWYCGISGILPETTVPLPLSDTLTDFGMVDPFPTYTYDEESQKNTSSIFVASPSDNKFLGLDDFATLKQALEGKSTNKMISPHLLAQVLNSRLSQSAILETLKRGIVFEERNKFLRQDGFNFAMASDIFYSIVNDPETDKDIYVTVEEKIREIQSILDAGGGAGGSGIVTINGLAASAGSSDIALTSRYVLAGSEFIQGLAGLSSDWEHGFTENQALSGILSVSIRRFDALYNGLNSRVSDLENGLVITSQVQSVNGVSPTNGNILLKAENIPFSLKNNRGEDFPLSSSIGYQNLQDFFESIQHAIFSVNGYSAYFDSSSDRLIGHISIYGDTMFLTEHDPSSSDYSGSDWDGNPLNEKTVFNLAYDVYTYCPKGIVINDGEMARTDGEGVLYLYIRAENIIVREEWMDDMQDYSRIYLTDSLYELNYLKMGAPDYSLLESDISRDTDQLANTSGWIIVNAQSDSAVAKPIKVIIDGSTITKMSCETGHWQTVVIPVMEDMTWSVTVPSPGADWIEWEIKFLPCIPLYMI